MAISRDTIIDSIKQSFEANPFVHAFWLEGADAHDRVDAYSDIDMWFDVEDGKEDDFFIGLRNLLSNIGTIDFDHETDHPHPKIRQCFFHLEGTSEFLIIDVCVQSHSRVFWYTNGHADEKVQILFDKSNVIEYRDADEPEGQEKKISELKETFSFFHAWVNKPIRRGHFLEAYKYYHQYVLDPLVEVLRMKYAPTKYDFGLKHIYHDLPKDVVVLLEKLYAVSTTDDISSNLKAASNLFFDVVADLERNL